MGKPKFVEISRVQGEAVASILKSKLEDEGIPVLLQYESMGRVIGLTVDGLGQVKILVPAELAERAKEVIKPSESQEPSEY